jgi:hypothetical protein
MKNLKLTRSAALVAFSAFLMTSCLFEQDPGPIQEIERDYSFTGFSRLEVGDAFDVTVTQGAEYAIHVKGDRRNVEDMVVDQDNDKLRFKFRSGQRMRSRQHTTFITITMPSLTKADFSGAVTADLSAFQETDFALSLSGASMANAKVTASNVDFDLSGASKLYVEGGSNTMDLKLSGASFFGGLDFEVDNADVDLSGASNVQVHVTSALKASASGASSVVYRGSPVLTSSMSGASTIRTE